MKRIFTAITGASGVEYGRRFLSLIADMKIEAHLSVSKSASQVIKHELGIDFDIENPDIASFIGRKTNIRYYPPDCIDAPPASGGYIDSMVVVPCSMGTLARIANGISGNLIERAADVVLKQKRDLIVVPRETPFNIIHLENMLRLARAGGIILPAMPAFYHNPESINDMVDFIAGKILDILHIQHTLYKKWGERKA